MFIELLALQSIYDKIKDLNFSDCHTKIRQVDSHPTLGDGVVVQVGGVLELSAVRGRVNAHFCIH